MGDYNDILFKVKIKNEYSRMINRKITVNRCITKDHITNEITNDFLEVFPIHKLDENEFITQEQATVLNVHEDKELIVVSLLSENNSIEAAILWASDEYLDDKL